MIRRLLIEKYMLLEVKSVALKEIKAYLLDLTETESYRKLSSLWNKRYKKYGNFIKRLFSDNNNITEADLGQLIGILDRYEKYANTANIKDEISKDWKKITLTLQDMIDFLEDQEHRVIYTEKDRKSLQTILDLCGPLDKLIGKTFSCEHYDIILCDEYKLVVKPKTVKGSVAWSLSDDNGKLEKFGPNHLDPKHRITWCTSVYTADDDSWNEFLGYYYGNLTTLYYVINRDKYSYGSNNRKICIGVDDVTNNIIFKGLETVDALNRPIESEVQIYNMFDGDDGEEIIESILKDKDPSEGKLIPRRYSKKDLRVLYKARNKSPAARAMFRTFLLTNGSYIGDTEKLGYCLDLLLSSYSNSNSDSEFIIDIVKGIFISGQLNDKIYFDDDLLKIITKIANLKNINVLYDLIDSILKIVEDIDPDIFDTSLLPVLEVIIQNSSVPGLQGSIEKIIHRIDQDSTTIPLADLQSSRNNLSSKKETSKLLNDKAEKGSAEEIDELLLSGEHRNNNPSFNSKLLKNPNLIKSSLGMQLIDEIYFNKSGKDSIFPNVYEAIMRNIDISNHPKIKELLYKYASDRFMMYNAISTQFNNMSIIFPNKDEMHNFLSVVYLYYSKLGTNESQEVSTEITYNFNEDQYSLEKEAIDTTPFSEEIKKVLS